ncbi:MAG: hypothetical protein NTW32_27210 [Chloroflexi bacterium]|nr:hypothetical protein [Chloroflexota bacterium]
MRNNSRENITTTLERLSTTFTTRDIMVPENRLTWAHSESEADRLLVENPAFDVIPIKRCGEYQSYLLRDAVLQNPIQVDDIISDSTPIIDLPGLFHNKDFFFVLSGKKISGYIHFSDLNNQLVKIPYFVLLEAVESRIIEKIEHMIKESDIDHMFPKQATRIKNKQAELRKEQADRGYVNGFYFKEMLLLAEYFHVLSLSDADLNLVNQIRNRVDHPDRPLIKTKKDSANLAKTRDLCTQMLDQLGRDRIEENK